MATNESADLATSLLKEKTGYLERQMFIQLLALAMISLTVTGYMFYQASLLRKNIDANQRVIDTLNENRKGMTDFLNELAAFGQKNPDFEQQVLVKNGLVAPTGASPKK